MSPKDKLHRLVDELPEVELHAAERYLEYLRDRANDPVLKAFMEAPVVDEPFTEEELAEIKEAEEEIARGETVPWEQVKADLREAKRRDLEARRKRRRAS